MVTNDRMYQKTMSNELYQKTMSKE
jgi:hypothetical protein